MKTYRQEGPLYIKAYVPNDEKIAMNLSDRNGNLWIKPGSEYYLCLKPQGTDRVSLPSHILGLLSWAIEFSQILYVKDNNKGTSRSLKRLNSAQCSTLLTVLKSEEGIERMVKDLVLRHVFIAYHQSCGRYHTVYNDPYFPDREIKVYRPKQQEEFEPVGKAVVNFIGDRTFTLVLYVHGEEKEIMFDVKLDSNRLPEISFNRQTLFIYCADGLWIDINLNQTEIRFYDNERIVIVDVNLGEMDCEIFLNQK